MRVQVLFAVGLLFACSSERGAPPEGILDRDRFKQALLEAQLVEARMNHELVVSRQTGIPAEDYYAEMFRQLGITRQEFGKSFTYYSGRPEEMKLIYEEILTELGRRKDEELQVEPA